MCACRRKFHPHDANELIAALRGLTSKFVPYAISFMVLGLRWLSTIQVRSRGESFGREYVVTRTESGQPKRNVLT